MKEKYFERVCNLGDLYLEKVFMKFEDENILFICRDENGERFLGVCYEMRYELKWVLCKITKETILQMLINNITVYECFEKQDNVLLITYSEKQGEMSRWNALGNVERRILPDKDFYLKYDMKKDAYYLNICYEIFNEKNVVENFLKLEEASYVHKSGVSSTNGMSKTSFVVRNRRSYSTADQSADKEWMNYCA